MHVIAGSSPLSDGLCCRYFDKASAVFETSPGNPPESLGVQMSKMAVGLLSGKYSQPPEVEDPATVKGAEPEEKMEVSEGEKPSGAAGEEPERKAAMVCGVAVGASSGSLASSPHILHECIIAQSRRNSIVRASAQ